MAKKDALELVVVRVTPNDDGSVTFTRGTLVPGDDELGFNEGQTWIVGDEAALALAEAIPNAVQSARVVAASGG